MTDSLCDTLRIPSSPKDSNIFSMNRFNPVGFNSSNKSFSSESIEYEKLEKEFEEGKISQEECKKRKD